MENLGCSFLSLDTDGRVVRLDSVAKVRPALQSPAFLHSFGGCHRAARGAFTRLVRLSAGRTAVQAARLPGPVPPSSMHMFMMALAPTAANRSPEASAAPCARELTSC